MKKIIALFIIIMFMVFSVGYCSNKIMTVDDLISKYPSIQQVSIWIYINIVYQADKKEYWQSPNETLELRTGDCEDFAILFWECGQRFKVPVTFAGARYYDFNNKKTAHAFCLIDYDNETETCAGFFDNSRGLDIFKEKRNVRNVIKDFKEYTWTRIYIFKKRNNAHYNQLNGWKLIQIIRREK